MNTKQRQEWERAVQVAAKITNVTGGNRFDLAHEVAELLALAKRLDRYNETECNYGLTPAQEKRVENLEKRIRAMCDTWRIGVKFNGDPRGYAVRLMFPDQSYNTWGGAEEGWGI